MGAAALPLSPPEPARSPPCKASPTTEWRCHGIVIRLDDDFPRSTRIPAAAYPQNGLPRRNTLKLADMGKNR
jgi:hypothetical protein